MSNKYSLYTDDKRAEEAIDAAVKKAAEILSKVMHKYEDWGALDTVAREAILDEVYDEIS